MIALCLLLPLFLLPTDVGKLNQVEHRPNSSVNDAWKSGIVVSQIKPGHYQVVGIGTYWIEGYLVMQTPFKGTFHHYGVYYKGEVSCWEWDWQTKTWRGDCYGKWVLRKQLPRAQSTEAK